MHGVFLRPSRRVRVFAFLFFFVAATWTFTVKSRSLCSAEEAIARDYPLIYRHVHSFNGTGGGKSDISKSFTVGNAH